MSIKINNILPAFYGNAININFNNNTEQNFIKIIDENTETQETFVLDKETMGELFSTDNAIMSYEQIYYYKVPFQTSYKGEGKAMLVLKEGKHISDHIWPEAFYCFLMSTDLGTRLGGIDLFGYSQLSGPVEFPEPQDFYLAVTDASNGIKLEFADIKSAAENLLSCFDLQITWQETNQVETYDLYLNIKEAWGTNEDIATSQANSFDQSTNAATFLIDNSLLTIGSYYYLQINDSNYGLARYIEKPETELIFNLDTFTATFTFNAKNQEYLYSTIFYLISDDKTEPVEISREIIQSYNNTNLKSITQTYTFKKYITNTTYWVKVKYITLNGLSEEVSSDKKTYQLNSNDSNQLLLDDTILYDQCCLYIKSIAPGQIYKAENGTDNYIYLGEIQEAATSEGLQGTKIKDVSFEHGKSYIYRLKSNDQYSNITSPIAVDFEDIFMYDNEKQLRIRFNPKIASYKINHLETKIETIGSQYPIIFRNNKIAYKEFPVAGLISYLSDTENLFLNLHETEDNPYGRPETAGMPSNIGNTSQAGYQHLNREIIKERQFKMEVLNWLNNGKPKVFKSPIEGNSIVRIMNVSLTPEEKLGRMLHSLQCTAVEIDDYNLNTLEKYNLLTLK